MAFTAAGQFLSVLYGLVLALNVIALMTVARHTAITILLQVPATFLLLGLAFLVAFGTPPGSPNARWWLALAWASLAAAAFELIAIPWSFLIKRPSAAPRI